MWTSEVLVEKNLKRFFENYGVFAWTRQYGQRGGGGQFCADVLDGGPSTHLYNKISFARQPISIHSHIMPHKIPARCCCNESLVRFTFLTLTEEEVEKTIKDLF